MRIPALAVMVGVFAATAALAGNDKPRLLNKPIHTVKPTHTAFNDHPNRGQIASDCNHRAEDRELMGIDRQDYVEWCTSRGHRYDRSRMDDYWNDDRTCYGRANDHVMTGDRRAEFLSNCLESDDERRHSPP
jgi:hypothetical protein